MKPTQANIKGIALVTSTGLSGNRLNVPASEPREDRIIADERESVGWELNEVNADWPRRRPEDRHLALRWCILPTIGALTYPLRAETTAK